MKKYILCAACLLTSTLLTACDAPTPAASAGKLSGIAQPVLEARLAACAATPRWVGTEENEAAKTYLADAFTALGYDTTTQEFEFVAQDALLGVQKSNRTSNVLAVKKAPADDADILIVSAHYDTMPGTVGANDNASGTAVLLELAAAVADADTDTELRFVVFSGEEEGLLGSSHYVKNLTETEKSRIIGDIQIDMLGHYQCAELCVKTPSGDETLLENLLQDSAQSLTGKPLGRGTSVASDHMSFISAGIPAVLVMQDNLGVENHKSADNTSIIDGALLKNAADILCDTLLDVMSTDTAQLAQQSLALYDPASTVAPFNEKSVFYFVEKKSLNDGSAGGPGTLARTVHDEITDWDLEYYTYRAKWFGLDKPLPVEFEYRVLDGNRFLQTITLQAGAAGYTEAELRATLSALCGEQIAELGENTWADKVNQKVYTLRKSKKTPSEWEIAVESGHEQKSLRFYDISGGIEAYKTAPATEYRILEFVKSITGADDPFVDTVEIWTDGLSYELGAAYPTNPEKNDKFTVRIDIADMYRDDGSFRNRDKTLSLFVHEYFHVLTLNSTQCDLSRKNPDLTYYDSASFLPGSYLGAFYDKFWKSLGTEAGGTLFYEHPTWFVDEYASHNTNEDIAESFALFVLSNKPEGDTIAEQKIRFFYEYPALVALRDSIRTNFT